MNLKCNISIFELICLILKCIEVYKSLSPHPRKSSLITGRNKVVAKVMFLLVSVILLTGGVCLSACWDTTPPCKQTPLPNEAPPKREAHPWKQIPPRRRHPPPLEADPPRSRPPRDTVILLECILVAN